MADAMLTTLIKLMDMIASWIFPLFIGFVFGCLYSKRPPSQWSL